MNCKLVHKPAFQVIGFSASIRPEEGYQKCPAFWEEAYAKKYARLFQTMQPETEEEQAVCDNRIGMLALCIEGANGFEYMIAGEYQGGNVPAGMKLFDFAESDWMQFSAYGPLPSSLQQLNNEIWQTWYPAEGQAFEPNGGATVEYYSVGDQLAADYECGIWIPVKRKENKESEVPMQSVYDFLKTCGTYYLATVEGGQPRVRPFGTIDLFEGRLYIQTGKIKAVSQQMHQNPKIEICACAGGEWLRVQALAVEDDRAEARRHMLEAYPELQRMYAVDDGNTEVFYLKDATATFSSFTKAPTQVKFG